ncbi:MAG: glycosyltransferase, partial [Saprospiraceae bacterium]|nr:glycosyltransferase [Saprospiraceae bacterium]
MRINIVIPVSNQANEIPFAIKSIIATLKKFSGVRFRLFILNDASNDKSGKAIVRALTEARTGLEIYLMDNHKTEGPTKSMLKLYQVALQEPCEFIIKMEINRTFSYDEVLTKFCTYLKLNSGKTDEVVTGFRTLFSQLGPTPENKEETQERLQEMSASGCSEDYFPESVGVQAFPSGLLKRLLNAEVVQSYGKAWGLDVLLPITAKKWGCTLTTIPMYENSFSPRPGESASQESQDKAFQLVLRMISA